MFRQKFQIPPGGNVLEYKHDHLHHMGNHAKRQNIATMEDGQLVSVVYVTAEPTFTGVIGGYTTVDDAPATSTAAPSLFSSTQTSVSAAVTRSADTASYQTVDETFTTPTTVAATSALTSGSSSVSSRISVAATSSSYVSSQATSVRPQTYPTSASDPTTSGSNSSTSTSSTDAGMSTAGKAGLAVGVILAVGAVLGLILFLLAKKKKQIKDDQAREDNEKNATIAAANTRASTQANAPRLSFRPASSFMPEFMARPKSRLSSNMLGAPSNEPNPTREKYLAAQNPIQMTEKSSPAENPFKDPENPFADPIRSAPAPPQPAAPREPIAMPEPHPTPAPVQMPAPAPMRMPSPTPDPVSEKIALAAAGAGAVAAARAAMHHESPRHAPQQAQMVDPQQQEPIEMPSPPVAVPAPLSTAKSVISEGTPTGAAGPDGQVYRILMDFTPSMEDELELRTGQVVRMLHEYDDGWCLCTRLDRSQQGVVPRTCLAPKPSKPRPVPGPQNGRPMSPAMGPPGTGPRVRTMSPAMRNGPPRGRPMSPGMGSPRSSAQGSPRGPLPQGRSMSPAPRKMSAQAGMRPMSPGAYNQPPRPLSPGPRSNPKRSQSPGPYGHTGGPAPMAQPRRRSNSSSQVAREVRERRQSPPGPSPLGGAGLGLAL